MCNCYTLWIFFSGTTIVKLCDIYVTDTGWGNDSMEGTDVRTVKPFAMSPTRFYQGRPGLAIGRISVHGSRAVSYGATLIKLK